MKVPKEIQRIWKKQLDPSDTEEIAKVYNINIRTIIREKKDGRCHRKTMDFINLYLTKKKFERQEFLNAFKNDDDGN